MPRNNRFFYEDPEQPGWTVVCYTNPRRRRCHPEVAMVRDAEMRMRMEDPVYRYRHDQLQHQIGHVQRLLRNPKYYREFMEDAEKYDPSWLPEKYVGEHERLPRRYCPASGLYLPRYAFNRGEIICKSCSLLPVPYYPHQSHEPVIVDKRQPTDGEGVVYDGSRPRHMTSAAVHARRQPEREQVQTEFAKDFVKRMVDARKKLELTQEELARKISRSLGDVKLFEKGDLPYNTAFKSLCLAFLERNKEALTA